MKKRILCALMALVMLISLVPVTTMTASAASLKTSEDAIRVLKDFEGYRYNAYEDPVGSGKYSIGYGTSSVAGATMTELEADKALRAELPEIEAAVNTIPGLNQYKFDALVLFSYNCGTAWISGSGTFKSAVVNGKTGNDFLYAICLWSNINSVPSSGLLNRRLAEANMYLNGVYSKNPPSNYTYVIYDANGGSVSDKMQGYNSSSAVAIKAEASRADHTFLGWYTDKNEWVTSLTSAVAGKTLTAHWQAKDAQPLDHVVDYTLSADRLVDKVMYNNPNGTSNGSVTATSVRIVRDYIDAKGTRWGKISMSGWVKIGTPAVVEENAPTVGAGTVVTVTNAYINVRQQASASSNKVGTVYYGEQLTLLDVVSNNGALWGQTSKGWIALMYTNYESVKVEVEQAPVEDKVIATAVVKCEADSYVNVRKGAGVNNTPVSSLKNGTKVDLYEITTVDGHQWGRIAEGWFCLDYATVTEVEEGTESDKEEEEKPAEPVIATGTVISNTALNVRSGAGVTNGLVGSKVKGTALNIYEITTVNGHEWGRIGVDQWVCLTYVSYTKVENSEDDKTDTTPDTKPEGTTASALFTGTAVSNVNIREKADASSQKLGAYAKGDKVSVSEVVAGFKADGTTAAVWGKVQFTNDKKETVNGWVCLTGNVTLDPVNYTVISNSLNVREDAGTANKSINKLSKGTVVAISELKFVNEKSLWGYSKVFGGWMNITSDYMERTVSSTGAGSDETTGSEDSTSNGNSSTGGSTSSGYVGTGVVNGVQLNVRSGPGMAYGKIDTLMPGSEVTIHEFATADGMAWGRTDYGWVTLGYILMTSTGITGNGQKATIANTYLGVNVRSSATTNSAILTKIMVNSRVEILKQETVNGSNWGLTNVGWISMDYVLLDTDAGVDMDDLLNGGTTGGTTGETTGGTTDNNISSSEPTALSSYSATAAAATKVYKAAGSDESVGVEIAKDQAITVYELVTVGEGENASYWARVDEGWIETSKVTLKAIEQTYTVTSNSLNVRPGAGVASGDPIAKLKKGDVIEVTKLAIVKASIWGYIEEKEGWVNTSATYLTLGDLSVKEETSAAETNTNTNVNTGTNTNTNTNVNTNTNTNNGGILYTGTVNIWDGTAAKLKVRETAGGKEIDSLSPGVKVNIVEMTVINNMPWGKCGAGWICLTYVDLVPYNSTATDARVVLYANSVTIYEGAGSQYNTVGSYAKGTVVDILEVNGGWVRTPLGWIDASYLAP